MKPLFKQEIEMLYDLGYDGIELKEGLFWVDNNIIKYIDKETKEKVKICRKLVGDYLRVSFKKYKIPKDYLDKIETWEESINSNLETLTNLEQHSLSVIRNNTKENHEKITLISTGKDGNVTKYLADISGFAFTPMFNNTSLDVSDSYKMVKQIENVVVTNPKEGFYQWQKRTNHIPTRFNRACCTLFKEGNMIDALDKNKNYVFLLGMRNEESNGRSGYEDLWSNEKWSENWYGILPIREWDEFNLWLYILKNNIPINEKYKKGYNRVGCGIACPFYTKFTWQLDLYWYPSMFERWQNILYDDFIKNEKWISMNCTLKEYMTNWNGGQVRTIPNEEVITEFANHKGIDYNVAEKFFSHKCSSEGCNKNVLNSNLVAMNLKLLGRNTANFLCKKHLKEFFDIDENKYKEMIQDFKKQGCDLF